MKLITTKWISRFFLQVVAAFVFTAALANAETYVSIYASGGHCIQSTTVFTRTPFGGYQMETSVTSYPCMYPNGVYNCEYLVVANPQPAGANMSLFRPAPDRHLTPKQGARVEIDAGLNSAAGGKLAAINGLQDRRATRS